MTILIKTLFLSVTKYTYNPVHIKILNKYKQYHIK